MWSKIVDNFLISYEFDIILSKNLLNIKKY